MAWRSSRSPCRNVLRISRSVSIGSSRVKMRTSTWSSARRDPLGELVELIEQLGRARIGDVLQVHRLVARAGREDQLVELELDGPRLPVLGVLNEKHDQERDDRRAGVDHELPGVRESDRRAD